MHKKSDTRLSPLSLQIAVFILICFGYVPGSTTKASETSSAVVQSRTNHRLAEEHPATKEWAVHHVLQHGHANAKDTDSERFGMAVQKLNQDQGLLNATVSPQANSTAELGSKNSTPLYQPLVKKNASTTSTADPQTLKPVSPGTRQLVDVRFTHTTAVYHHSNHTRAQPERTYMPATDVQATYLNLPKGMLRQSVCNKPCICACEKTFCKRRVCSPLPMTDSSNCTASGRSVCANECAEATLKPHINKGKDENLRERSKRNSPVRYSPKIRHLEPPTEAVQLHGPIFRRLLQIENRNKPSRESNIRATNETTRNNTRTKPKAPSPTPGGKNDSESAAGQPTRSTTTKSPSTRATSPPAKMIRYLVCDKPCICACERTFCTRSKCSSIQEADQTQCSKYCWSVCFDECKKTGLKP